MSDLRHIHDPVLSSLKMEGIRLLYLNSPTTGLVAFGVSGRFKADSHIAAVPMPFPCHAVR
jgi:hypothetical protein